MDDDPTDSDPEPFGVRPGEPERLDSSRDDDPGEIADSAKERNISEQEVVEEVLLGQARLKERMEPVEVANVVTLGFSQHAKHLDGGDLRFDGGFTLTYE